MTTPAGRTPLDHLTSDELDELYDRLADYENRITWHTTCGSCARILDSSIRETERAERAETTLDRIAALAAEHPAGIDTALVLEALDQTTLAATDADTTTRVFAALHYSAERDVTRVINLYERWVKAGPPLLGVSISRWWDARLVELHDAILPPMREQHERPTHANGTPYSYAEIRAEGWGYCEGCRMWSTGAPNPHQCPGPYNRAAPADQTKEQ